MMNLNKQVIEHLQQKGFNCIAQNNFPNIIAWKPFINEGGESLVLNVNTTINGKSRIKTLFPFFISMIECKKSLSKKEMRIAEEIIKEGRCSSFIIAYKDKNKLKFEEMEFEIPIPQKKPLPSYFG